MLMQKKRFHFNNAYLYGSAAFLLGYTGAIALFSHIAPVYTPSANIATVTETPKVDEVKVDTTTSDESEAKSEETATKTPVVTMQKSSTKSSSTPAQTQPATNPTVSEPVVTPPADEPIITPPELPIVPTPEVTLPVVDELLP